MEMEAFITDFNFHAAVTTNECVRVHPRLRLSGSPTSHPLACALAMSEVAAAPEPVLTLAHSPSQFL